MISPESFMDVATGIVITESQRQINAHDAMEVLGVLLQMSIVDVRHDCLPELRERLGEEAVSTVASCFIVDVQNTAENNRTIVLTVATKSHLHLEHAPRPSEIPGLTEAVKDIAKGLGHDLTMMTNDGWHVGSGTPADVLRRRLGQPTDDDIVTDFAKQLEAMFPSPEQANWPAPTAPEGGEDHETEQ